MHYRNAKISLDKKMDTDTLYCNCMFMSCHQKLATGDFHVYLQSKYGVIVSWATGNDVMFAAD